MANPFDEGNDDYLRGRQGLGLDPVKSYTTKTTKSIEKQMEDIDRDIEKYLEMSLDSTQRSCQQLESSDKLAEQTARELLEQREKLEKAETNLEEIHKTTQYTQRSLNSLKSLFGGMFKNKFSRLPKEKSKEEQQQQQNNAMGTSKSADQLTKIVDRVNGEKQGNVVPGGNGGQAAHSLNASSRAQIQGTRWEAMDNQIDQNLDQMSSQLARLRNWGTALGDEVDDQNRLLDRIQTKAERNDTVVRSQETQMRKLLG